VEVDVNGTPRTHGRSISIADPHFSMDDFALASSLRDRGRQEDRHVEFPRSTEQLTMRAFRVQRYEQRH
jgi:hypothetical protein